MLNERDALDARSLDCLDSSWVSEQRNVSRCVLEILRRAMSLVVLAMHAATPKPCIGKA